MSSYFITTKFISHRRVAQCPSDPKFPDGQELDMTKGARKACLVELPYPAECCGVHMVTCTLCRQVVAISAAGRPDDPRTAKIACKNFRDGQRAE